MILTRKTPAIPYFGLVIVPQNMHVTMVDATSIGRVKKNNDRNNALPRHLGDNGRSSFGLATLGTVEGVLRLFSTSRCRHLLYLSSR